MRRSSRGLKGGAQYLAAAAKKGKIRRKLENTHKEEENEMRGGRIEEKLRMGTWFSSAMLREKGRRCGNSACCCCVFAV